jgi:hypothetical protein
MVLACMFRWRPLPPAALACYSIVDQMDAAFQCPVVGSQEAKYVECWPNTTSAWAGWSRFDIPMDRSCSELSEVSVVISS